MNNSLKTVALISGIVIIAYGIYTLFKPETQISIGDVDLIKAQDNTNSYITIAIGIVIAALSSIIGKK
ncbi:MULTISPECIES: hypothetical protein [Tenacibaculum]|uniref:DUF3185 domain-containing protein n=1 Tax=Tenacibaculum discolor TaxID=361581 RepID=A0A2G1BVZ8_9FLAO|nr:MULTISPECIES: hypothetical protein [Tenacibaculum]PHO01907.1 hypothetical protein CSC82_21140 [Rhodobacteraceae bacterium 4F10]MDP2542768.1 hypothetical protein [Tenacibaculum discolor]NVK08140.1 hypothetical protein [Tenacibaculum sp.]PHN97765.1 hypothetical protein CSC81_04960 [Tenacibaculum discolor]RLJ96830.1 hypothetical protein C8N27_3093 [Tenacibaculum discolor]